MGKGATSVLLMVAISVALGSGRGESSNPRLQPATPAETTEERIEEIGRALSEAALDLAGGVPADTYPPEAALAILRRWTTTPECSVPAGLATANAGEIARYISEEAPESVEPAIAGILVDGWGNPIEVYLEPIALPERPRIVLRSPGANGEFEGLVYEAGEFAADDGDDDIVWSFGQFCRRSAEPTAEDASEEPPTTDADRQARTLTDLRHLGVALMSWFTDQLTDERDESARPSDPATTSAPCSPADAPSGAAVSAGRESPESPRGFRIPPQADRIDRGELEALLHPSDTFFYMETVPAQDGWGAPLEVYLQREDLSAEQLITIRSPGRDGSFEADCYTVGPFDPEDADQDIVWADGFFVRWPEDATPLEPGDTSPQGARGGESETSDSAPGASEHTEGDGSRPNTRALSQNRAL